MTENEIAVYIYQQCRNAGITKEGACALLANIQKESRFKPNNLEDTANNHSGMTDEQYTQAVDNGTYTNFIRDGWGYGLFQVTFYTRKQMFLNYVKSRRGSIGDYKLQVGYILWELQNMFPKIWGKMRSENDLYALTWLLLDEWENPYEKTANMKERYSYAQEWFKKIDSLSSQAKGSEAKMTEKEAIKKVLDLAADEIGYHEKSSNSNLDSKTANSGSGNWTKYARDLANLGNFYNGNKSGYPWCDVWVDWIFVACFGADTGRQMLCQPLNSAGAGCLYSAQYYKQAGRWVSSPQAGDQIFFTYSPGEYSHTGIVENVTGSMVYTIEGNTSDQVARRSYSLSSSSIAGYGRPKWELATGSPSSSVQPSTQTETTPIAQNQTIILRYGSNGKEVKELQEKLIKLGYNLGTWGADGDYGNDTLAAVKKFQKDHGLTQDGEAGPMTFAALDAAIKELQGSSETSSGSAAQAKEPAVGDTVEFKGTRHYLTAYSEKGYVCKPGKARITAYSRASYAKHPYHLVRASGGTSTVFGWVDRADFEVV